MLIDEVVDFCDRVYSSQDTKHVCPDCKHVIKCSGGCKRCLEEVHYPDKYPNGLKDYLCPNIINFYTCDYSYKYASEIWYLLRKTQTINKLDGLRIMSIGCGGCPDLMAFESFIKENKLDKSISYFGIDINELWKPVHKQIAQYAAMSKISIEFKYADAVQYFKDYYVSNKNVIVLQYVISHFYNTNQIGEIEKFFDDLIDSIILHKNGNEPFVVIVNDVNSCYRGRDYFDKLIERLEENSLHCTYSQYYFKYNIRNAMQRYGKMHICNDVLYDIPEKLEKYDPWKYCSSAQLLVELV